ncbi:DNA polymerase IV [Clostridium oceanicum]|uniref:DNA polymerase IV n=1 Tax=Clostridium oceanicum TaxID=1543 RepID=A0ABP3UPT6_9CLOT
MNKIIFHVDVNSAFLSWTAVDLINKGEKVDLREIPSVIGGDISQRKGVVLAKSHIAKKYGIKTGESIFSAKKKCSKLTIVRPNFDVYKKSSKDLMNLLSAYTERIEKFSIDECFLDLTYSNYKEPIKLALEIKEKIHKELGFTVNIGISTNKVLAKMASDFEKPNKIHTLYKNEIKEKMWPLPVENLFMVGEKSKQKLNTIGVYTIGDLANMPLQLTKGKFKKYGIMIWNYANGIDNSEVKNEGYKNKCISSSTTLSYNITKKEEAFKVLLNLSEDVCYRLRKLKKNCLSISVTIRNNDFKDYSHQKKIKNSTSSTEEVYNISKKLFLEMWNNEPIRLLGVSISNICKEEYYQVTLFEDKKKNKSSNLDRTIDGIREKYGENYIFRLSSKNKK